MRLAAWTVLVIETVAWVMPPTWVDARTDRKFLGGMQLDGIVVGPVLLQMGVKVDRCIDIHEHTHVNQWRQTGLVVFYASYGFHYLWNRTYRKMDHIMAYHSIPYEIEAYIIEGACGTGMIESVQ